MTNVTMYDGVTVGNIPSSATMVAGYVDGTYANLTALRKRFPKAKVVEICVFASTPAQAGRVLDCESGDATPAQAVQWCLAYSGSNKDLVVYTNTSEWPSVRAAFKAAGVTEPNYWVAQYDNVATIPAGAVAKQYRGDVSPGYDVSIVSSSWPGLTATPPVVAPPVVKPTPPAAAAHDWQKLQDYLHNIPEKSYENGDNVTIFGKQYGEYDEWCVVFDWYVYTNAGFGSIVPKTDNVSNFTDWAQARGQWSEYPSIGAWINFSNGEHTGMVVGFDANNVYTKEGNTTPPSGSGPVTWVASHTYARTSSYVTGYFAPKYPDGVCPPTANPADPRGGKAVASYRYTPAPVSSGSVDDVKAGVTKLLEDLL